MALKFREVLSGGGWVLVGGLGGPKGRRQYLSGFLSLFSIFSDALKAMMLLSLNSKKNLNPKP